MLRMKGIGVFVKPGAPTEEGAGRAWKHLNGKKCGKRTDREARMFKVCF